jgi:TPR repeat protein
MKSLVTVLSVSLCSAALAQVQVNPLEPTPAPVKKGAFPAVHPPPGMSRETLDLLEVQANAGDADALMRLASIAASDMDAFQFVLGAAQLGHAKAMVQVAEAYADGRGTPPNPKEAIAWARRSLATPVDQSVPAMVLLRAAQDESTRSEGLRILENGRETGDKRSVLLLSALYAQGAFGISVDEKMAGEVIRPLAEAGDPEAQVALASVYRFAKIHAGERDQAVIWLEKANAGGHPDAARILDEIRGGEDK